MKIEFEFTDEQLRTLALDSVRAQLGPKKVTTMLQVSVERTAEKVLGEYDFAPLIRQQIDSAVAEIVRDAVNGRLRSIVRATLTQEIEKLQAAAKA